MKDFATYTTLKREAMEFDEVRTRLQAQLVTRVPRSHTGPCNQMLAHSNQPATLMRDYSLRERVSSPAGSLRFDLSENV